VSDRHGTSLQFGRDRHGAAAFGTEPDIAGSVGAGHQTAIENPGNAPVPSTADCAPVVNTPAETAAFPVASAGAQLSCEVIDAPGYRPIDTGLQGNDAEITPLIPQPETCQACRGSARNFHFGHLVCGACGGSGVAPVDAPRSRAVRPQSLAREAYESAWRIKESLR